MSIGLIAIVVMMVLGVGYVLYGSYIARQYRLDDQAATPAVTKEDGLDFVPTRPFYLLAQHFSAIAAAGPIVGPILACLAFGWGPCLLWIMLGVIFIGAVHDFSALVASIRHGAHSVAEIAREHLGKRAWAALVAFIYLALLYIIVAFTDVTAQTFKGLSDELLAVRGSVGGEVFNKGGAVAAASVMYLLLALVMGVVARFLKWPTWLLTVVFVPLTLGVVWLGTMMDGVLNFDVRTWYVVILAYCLIASMLPMWLLQQPRGYLGGFVLFLAIGVGLVGALAGGFSIQQPMFKPLADYSAFFGGSAGGGATPPMTTLLFPFLFVTIACGACSGFHGLICGGTTSKQVAKESHCKPVAFGAMLLEGLVAVIALSTVMIVASGEVKGRSPGVLYGDGLALYITKLVDPGAIARGDAASSAVFALAATFGAMAFSTFVFDTLDVSTRLGRYLLTELFGAKGKAAGILAAALTAGIPLLILMMPNVAARADGQAGPPPYMVFWTLFGTANQLLAALTLMGVSVWLYRTGRKFWYTLVPMCFVLAITLSALGIIILQGIRGLIAGGSILSAPVMNGGVALALTALAGIFVWEATASVRRTMRERASGAAAVAGGKR